MQTESRPPASCIVLIGVEYGADAWRASPEPPVLKDQALQFRWNARVS
jgi:hypothetical protein